MQRKPARLLVATTALLLVSFLISRATEVTVHAIAANPRSVDHRSVALQGFATAVTETTSHRGNAYTTFKLRDANGGDAVSIFSWGHPALRDGDHIRVDGVFRQLKSCLCRNKRSLARCRRDDLRLVWPSRLTVINAVWHQDISFIALSIGRASTER